MHSPHAQPLIVGPSDGDINELEMIIEVSGKWGLRSRHLPGPQGVRGRNSDNTKLEEILGWEPGMFLEENLAPRTDGSRSTSRATHELQGCRSCRSMNSTGAHPRP